MQAIPLGGRDAAGRVALIDDSDYELVSAYRWVIFEKPPHRGIRSRGPYARALYWRGDMRATVFMHKLITGWPCTDHINHNGLDNQRSNLRPATPAQNAHNARPDAGSSSQFKGVTWHRRVGKWQAAIRVNGRHRYLGVFASEEEAALAYDAVALEAWGEYAYLNFQATREAS